MKAQLALALCALGASLTAAACSGAASDDPELVIDSAQSQALRATLVMVGERVAVETAVEERPVALIASSSADEGTNEVPSDAVTRANHHVRVVTVRGEDGTIHAQWATDAETGQPSGYLGGHSFGDPANADEESNSGTWKPIVSSHTGEVLKALARAVIARGGSEDLGERRADLETAGGMYEFLQGLSGNDGVTIDASGAETTGTVSAAVDKLSGSITWDGGGLFHSGVFEGRVRGTGRVCITMYESTKKHFAARDAQYHSTVHCRNGSASVRAKVHMSCDDGEAFAKAWIWHKSGARWTNELHRYVDCD